MISRIKQRKYASYSILLAVSLLPVLTNCDKKKQEVAATENTPISVAGLLVANSIERHGGLEKWWALSMLEYDKTTILYDSAGHEESRITQHHEYEFKPTFRGRISWESDGDQHEILYRDEVAWKIVNGAVKDLREDSTAARNSVLAAHFVLFQPFKLHGENLGYLGKGSMKGDPENEVVRPIYGNEDEGGDRWWFFIDPETDLVTANMVDHSGRFSLIRNLQYDSLTGLVLHRYRKSFFTDSLESIRYLRAEYYYQNYVAEYE